ncbi:MAG: cache domain-containing protein [Deltaproteobacteria bacterium]|nr:cache domain-containing protein [Candidatus Anaeroferrophillus wilburensis]
MYIMLFMDVYLRGGVQEYILGRQISWAENRGLRLICLRAGKKLRIGVPGLIHSFTRFFRNLNIRAKLFGGYSAILVISILLCSFVIYSLMRTTVETNIERELQNSTAAILNMVQTTASVSIKNYLRSVAEKNLDIVQHFYAKQLSGELSENEAKNQALQIFYSQTIGKTGYLYCINSGGVAVAHPNKSVAGRNFSNVDFVIEQIKRKEGYLEYGWRNPGELEKRSKALYMSYFAPWDWIISVTSYREEFKELVKVSDFSERILAMRFGKSGYSFVLDSLGNVVVHPIIKGNVFDAVDSEGHLFVQELCRQKNGKLIYTWKNPGEKIFREKLVMFNYIPEYDWIVASSSYLDEIYAPLQQVKKIFVAAVSVTLLLILPLTLWISASIIRPMRELIGRLTAATAGDLTVRMSQAPNDEIGHLARHFNIFMEKLELYHNNLQQEISERQRLERELLNISEREKQKFGRILHDDLCPHLIGIEAMTKVLKEKLDKEQTPQANLAEKIRGFIRQAIDKTRRLARGLMPVDPAAHGLETSLAEMAEIVAEIYNVACSFECEAIRIPEDSEVATHIYYIVHEAVHNAVKHGQAKNIVVRLTMTAETLRVEIADDGRGLPENLNPKGMGLRILQYRTDCLRGSLTVDNLPGKGVKIVLSLPTTGNRYGKL